MCPVFGNPVRKFLAVRDPPRNAPALPLSNCLLTTIISHLHPRILACAQRATNKSRATIGSGFGACQRQMRLRVPQQTEKARPIGSAGLRSNELARDYGVNAMSSSVKSTVQPPALASPPASLPAGLCQPKLMPVMRLLAAAVTVATGIPPAMLANVVAIDAKVMPEVGP